MPIGSLNSEYFRINNQQQVYPYDGVSYGSSTNPFMGGTSTAKASSFDGGLKGFSFTNSNNSTGELSPDISGSELGNKLDFMA